MQKLAASRAPGSGDARIGRTGAGPVGDPPSGAGRVGDSPLGQGTVVVVEDDGAIAGLVDLYLRKEGFRVLCVGDGEAGVELHRRERPKLVILDVGLPGGLDGFGVCRAVRAASDVPILFLTARDDEIDRILGLELGADDYLVKPFSPRELVARVRAILRRTDGTGAGGPGAGGGRGPSVLEAGPLVLDEARREVRLGGEPVELTVREFELLSLLMRSRGHVLTRRQLLEGAWGPSWYGDERTVDVHVAQLRRKLGADFGLTTVRGVGYRFG